MKNLIVTFLIISTAFSLSAQSDLNIRKWNFELGFGINAMGPVSEMDKLMVEYGFDAISYNFFSGEDIQHPHYDEVGASCLLSFSYYVNQRSQVGLQFNYSLLNEIFGKGETVGFLFVRFRSMSFIPLYTYEMNKTWEVQIGPALMINSGKKPMAVI